MILSELARLAQPILPLGEASPEELLRLEEAAKFWQQPHILLRLAQHADEMAAMERKAGGHP